MIPALFQIRDPEMRAEYYERLREKREAEAKLPATIPPSIKPINCENLEASRELECLAKFFPEQLTAERLLKIKESLDSLLKGKGGSGGGGMRMPEPSVRSYDDGDGLNLEYR